MSEIRHYHSATLLPNGHVLVAGGDGNHYTSDTAERYNPLSGFWTAAGTMTTAREWQTATLLVNGRVLLAGGGANNDTAAIASAELYDAGLGFCVTTPPGPLAPGLLGTAYSQTLTVSGGTTPYTWSVVSNSLPAGLTLVASSGAITGTPTVLTIVNFIVRVTDTNGLTATQPFSLTINPPSLVLLAGTYTGLILQTNAPTFASYGTIKLVLSKTGSFAASLSLGGVATTFTGQFDPAGNATNTLAQPAVQVVLSLDVSGVTGRITGTVTGSGTAAALQANLAVFNTRNPCPWAGKYNCLLEPTTNNPAVPQGDGYAVFTVTPSGSGAYVGKLADGTALSVTMPVSKQGTWPLYKLLYANKGAVIGWLSFTPSNTVTAVVDWFKPPTSGRYSVGFNTVVALTGTKLAPPAGVGTWDLTLAAGDLPSNVVWTVAVSPTGKVTLPAADAYKLKLGVAPTTGKFTGSFVHPVSTKTVPFTGLFLQAPENDAGGFFLGPNTSGAVTLEP